MVDGLDVQLEQAEAARLTLRTLEDQAEQVEGLRQQIADRDRLGRARSVAANSEAQAEAAVADVKPQLETWRVSFRDWVREGWRLLLELRTLESRLLPALDVAVAGAVGLSNAQTFRPGDLDERVFLGQADADGAVDRLLERLGTADLDPFPDTPDGFPSDVVGVCLRYAGRVFLPRLGRVQFQRRGGRRL